MFPWDFTHVAFVALVLIGVVLHVRQKARLERAEKELLTHFTPGTAFIGKELSDIVAKAGPEALFKGMDHGQEVAQWRVGKVAVEVWFQHGRCTHVSVWHSKR